MASHRDTDTGGRAARDGHADSGGHADGGGAVAVTRTRSEHLGQSVKFALIAGGLVACLVWVACSVVNGLGRAFGGDAGVNLPRLNALDVSGGTGGAVVLVAFVCGFAVLRPRKRSADPRRNRANTGGGRVWPGAADPVQLRNSGADLADEVTR